MVLKDGKNVYPLRQSKITCGENVIFERNIPRRNRRWFILDLALPGKNFIPSGSTGFTTADGASFAERGRRK